MKTNHQIINAHIRQLHGFVDNIARYADDPINWPLSREEQIAFVRTAIYQARKLQKTEGFVTAAVMLASEDLAMAS